MHKDIGLIILVCDGDKKTMIKAERIKQATYDQSVVIHTFPAISDKERVH